MSEFTKTAETLRRMAVNLEDLDQKLMIPVERNCTVKAAAARLKALLGNDGHFEIQVDLTFYRSDRIVAEWRIWDGTKHYKASTLTDCLNSVLTAHSPGRDEVDVIDEAMKPENTPAF